jgi:hypothetical protein
VAYKENSRALRSHLIVANTNCTATIYAQITEHATAAPSEKNQLVSDPYTPTAEPTEANTQMSKQTALNAQMASQCLVNGATLFFTRYISTGKWMPSGQKVNAPSSPITWLKYENNLTQLEHVHASLAELHHRAAAEQPVREREHRHRLRVHLVSAEEVQDDAEVGEVDEPLGLVEAEPGEEVARGGVAERRVADAPAAEVEESGDQDARLRCRLHHRLGLRRRRLQRVLDFQQHQ